MSNLSIRLTRQAIRDHWPISQRNKERAIETIVEIMHEDEDPRNKIMAVRTLTAIDNLNVQREKNEILKQPKHIIHHKDLSDEELAEQLQMKLQELGISAISQAALPSLMSEDLSDGT